MAALRTALIIAIFSLGSAFSMHAFAQEDTAEENNEVSETIFDPEALEILKEMSDTLAGAQEFTFNTEVTNDRSLDTGQTIQVSGSMTAAVKRPDNVYAKYTGDFNTREVWYSGTTLTMFIPDKNFYGVLKTPDNIDATMDFLMDNYNFALPLADVISANPYESVMETTIGGFIVGDSNVRGTECTHLAFVGEYVDWQVWISNDDPALPYKLVIEYKQIESSPQYQAIFSNWNLDPKLQASTFKPDLPKDAVKIDFINFKKQEGEKK